MKLYQKPVVVASFPAFKLLPGDAERAAELELQFAHASLISQWIQDPDCPPNTFIDASGFVRLAFPVRITE